MCKKSLKDLDAAEINLRKAVALNPGLATPYCNLGLILKGQNKQDEAISCLEQALKIDPNYHTAQHYLNSMTGTTSKTAPKKFVQGFFNAYADMFEEKLVSDLKYRTPEVLCDALLKFDGGNKTYASAINLGFGTGLVWVAFKDLVDRVIGVDLSENMSKKMKKRRCIRHICG